MKFRKIPVGIAASLLTVGLLVLPAGATEVVSNADSLVTENGIEPLAQKSEQTEPEEKKVESLTLDKTELTLTKIGAQATLSVNVTPKDANAAKLTWTSSAPEIASVDQNGKVVSKKNGTAVITVQTEDGAVQTSCKVTVNVLNGICQNPENPEQYAYYVDGEINTSVNSVVQGSDGWWKVKNGIVDSTYTGVASNSYGTWRIEDGKVDFGYNGFAEDGDDYWYLTDGKVDTSYNGITNDATAWWKVKNGKVDTSYTGVSNNMNGWWRVENGKVNFNYNGLAQNEYGWWKIENGRVNFDYYGAAENENGWWIVEGGKVDFNYNGITNSPIGWCKFKDGRIDTGYTGVANNQYGWWRVENGKVNFDYNGLAQNENGWWMIENGQLNFNYWGVVQNEYGWWRVERGTVNFNYNGVANNAYGWWKCNGGKVDFGYNGVATNEYGAWYISNGMVDFYRNGWSQWNGISCYFSYGRLLPVNVSNTMYAKTRGVSSDTNWLILTDTSGCRVGVFYGTDGNWTAVKYLSCTPGKASTPTVKGTFTVQGRGKSFGSDTYTCWYYTQFYHDYLFHSVIYNKGSMTSIQDGRLGTQLSHGCVRLDINEAKWIYDNIPNGTKVIVY